VVGKVVLALEGGLQRELVKQGLFSFFYLAALIISTMAQAQYETVLDEMVLAVEQEFHATYLRH
jgi:hypothetical protein